MNCNYIDIDEKSYEQSFSYFKRLENLEKIRRKSCFITNSIGKSSKNLNNANMWCHYWDKNNHNMVDCREIAKLEQQN
jgi:hypothetical protein